MVTPKKILITGANGQVGQAIAEESINLKDVIFVFLTREELDITSESSIRNTITKYLPDIIINTAAYTTVDAAEDNIKQAYLINETAVLFLTRCCKKANIGLIHISTDYVFDGNKIDGYTELDVPNPQTVYGASKLAGEKAIIDAQLSHFAIVRTSWVYSKYGSNFVKTMLRLAQERSELSVVDDQKGNPTLANDLARALLIMATKLNIENSGIYNYSNEGSTTWFSFAKAIFLHTTTPVKVNPVSSDQFPTKALRPKNSVLQKEKIIQIFDVKIPKWEVSLKDILRKI